jgi:hypothetical protein
MRRILLIAAVSGGMTVPVVAHACTCLSVVPLGSTPKITSWTERSVIFTGTLLTTDPTGTGTVARRSRWVVDASWRGEMPDTVTMVNGPDAPCPTLLTPGTRYLVVADQRDSVVTTTGCGTATRPIAMAESQLGQLGPPEWTAAPYPQRRFDSDIIPVGAAAPQLPEVWVGLVFRDRAGASRVQVADRVWDHPWLPINLMLPEGLYRIRIVYTTGDSTETDLAVRCEERSGLDCSAFRIFSGERVQLPPRR